MSSLEIKCYSCQRQQNASRRQTKREPVSTTKYQLILVLLCYVILPSLAEEPLVKLPSVIRFEDSVNGPETPYFRCMHLTDTHVYIGAMEYIYRLSLTDIQDSLRSQQLVAPADDYSSCVSDDTNADGYECHNHIRTIAFIDNQIYACGTGAHYPIEFYLDSNLQTTAPLERSRGKCPFTPDQAHTAVYITEGNPDDVSRLYSATYLNVAGTRSAISRQAIDAIPTLAVNSGDSVHLNEPEFVDSFDVGEHVYFFFRETALEVANCEPAIYSRVARICKGDRGGPYQLDGSWSTYLKARLNCSASADGASFAFDRLQGVQRVGDTFYGVFTTPRVGLFGSAVCAFSQEKIAEAFNGTFRERPREDAVWRATPETDIPVPRPGTCLSDTRRMSSAAEQFINARPLMWQPVEALSESEPIVQQSGTIYTTLAVDASRTDFRVFYLATEAGHLHKVVQWQSGTDMRSSTVVVWTPLGDNTGRIWQLELVQGSARSDDQLYLTTDEAVVQLSVAQCDTYATCTECLRDPHCGWQTWDGECVSRKMSNSIATAEPWDADLLNRCGSLCRARTGVTSHAVQLPGDTVQLDCPSNCDLDDVTWYHNNQELSVGRYTLTHDNGLVLFNVSRSDAGSYDCSSSGVVIAQHTVQLDEDCADDIECIWKKNFREWCSQFDTYRRQFNNWVCLKDQCLSQEDGTCIPQPVVDQCPYSIAP